MGRALSRDLRDREAAAVEGGLSCRAAAERFGVSAASAIRWRQLVVQQGTPAARPQGGDRRSTKIEDHAALIHAAIERQAYIMLDELRAMLAGHGVSTSIATLWRFFARHGSRAKRTVHASEQNRADIVERRWAWFEGQLDLGPERPWYSTAQSTATPSAPVSTR